MSGYWLGVLTIPALAAALFLALAAAFHSRVLPPAETTPPTEDRA